MKQFNKKILIVSIMIALDATAGAWADSSSTADSISSSTAIVAVSTNDPSAVATDAAVNGSGSASSDHSDHSAADVSAQGSAAANNGGNATTINSDNADRSQTSSNGIGSAAANNGASATSNYRVSNQSLSGTVTGNSSSLPISARGYSSLSFGNNIDQSLVGNAGITQTVQNSGTGLVQQSVAVDGTVSVAQGTASIAP